MSSHLDYEINKELGECYLFMGELDKAESYYHKAASSNGVHPDPYLGLATIAVQRGDLDQAMAMYQKAENIASSDKSIAGIALVSAHQGQEGKAFDLYLKALSLNPENIVALFGLVQVAHVLGRTAEAITPLEQHLELNPGKSEVRYALSGCLVSCGRKDEARAHLHRLMEMDPANVSATELLAQL